MLPRDQFDRRFDTVAAALLAWAETLRDVAEVTIETTPAFWRLRLDPCANGPCPVELILHRNQTFDVMIAAEAYEGEALRGLGDLEAMEPLLAAIVAGNVTTETVRSSATDRLLTITTVVGPAAAPLFQRTRNSGIAGSGIVAVRHYPPFRRT